MNLLRLIGALGAANRMSSALSRGRKPNPIDVEQLGLTEIMKRRSR